jgi:pristinamycin I synthase-2
MNLYGPSEDTTYSTAHSMSASDEAVSIGRSLPGKGALVCDDQVSPLPIGVPGELCLFGPGLARGYVNARSSTALRFVPHPLSPVPGARLYRTGDRVRLSARGELRFDGRIDRQLKLRGFRIEPSEIEHVIGRDPGVVTSAVIVDDRLPAHPSLVAFVVPTSTEGEAQGILGRARARALESLPPYMVPQRFVLVEKLHVTANGKLDRVALLAQLGAEAPVAPVAPRSELERELLGSWQTWLSTTQLGVFDSLFAHGADSLLLLRFVAEVRERYGVELSIKDAFRYPSVAAVCELIEDRRRHPTDRDDALLRSVERLSDEEAHRMLEAMERDAK